MLLCRDMCTLSLLVVIVVVRCFVADAIFCAERLVRLHMRCCDVKGWIIFDGTEYLALWTKAGKSVHWFPFIIRVKFS